MIGKPLKIRDFSCRRCGACCRIPGQIHLTATDIARLAAFLGLSEYDFIQRHTDLARNRRGLVIQGDPAWPCRFLQANDCTVYPARPLQCADYPVRWNNPGWDRICRNVPTGAGTQPGA